MGRPRQAGAKTTTIPVKLSEADVRALDTIRGGTARSTYIRAALRSTLRRSGTPQPIVEHPIPAPEEHQQPAIPHPTRPHQPSVAQNPAGRHLHRYKKAPDPFTYIRGVPQYRQKCDCGATKEGP